MYRFSYLGGAVTAAAAMQGDFGFTRTNDDAFLGGGLGVVKGNVGMGASVEAAVEVGVAEHNLDIAAGFVERNCLHELGGLAERSPVAPYGGAVWARHYRMPEQVPSGRCTNRADCERSKCRVEYCGRRPGVDRHRGGECRNGGPINGRWWAAVASSHRRGRVR